MPREQHRQRRKIDARRLAIDIARQAMLQLYRLSVEQARRGDYETARRLIEHALEIHRRLRVRKPIPLRRAICPNCHAPLVPGVTARVRLRSRGKHIRITTTCLLCGYMLRIEERKS